MRRRFSVGTLQCVIVVVTGPSAAGKTTWCRRHHWDDVIPEYVPTGREPDDAGPVTRAAFWCQVKCSRWGAAVRREQVSGLAVCDDDPLKLHYVWSLVRLGLAAPQQWHQEVEANREAVAGKLLGLPTWCWCPFLRRTSCGGAGRRTPRVGVGTSNGMFG